MLWLWNCNIYYKILAIEGFMCWIYDLTNFSCWRNMKIYSVCTITGTRRAQKASIQCSIACRNLERSIASWDHKKWTCIWGLLGDHSNSINYTSLKMRCQFPCMKRSKSELWMISSANRKLKSRKDTDYCRWW